ncbi:hypothetical protein FLAG1_00500 [Fusarium langsethiae]|uniref:Uncharacterized protein n=1 Tax=Fusarium langsethiae TaxID=179993 RepID=A0A0N0DI81_FUSLA|nr:hypothetical protein FLAG1_00500 [Fusarium langsethiae]GKT98389.1 unnamed protein product [Fusarium langsethiae]GKU13125.1 unnamed protein product [Fusarium langsethiae]
MISPHTLQMLRSSKVAGRALATKLEQVATKLKSRGSIEIVMLFPPTIGEKVTRLTELYSIRNDMDKETSPLILYFRHSPSVRQLTFEQFPAPGSEGFPSYMHGLRLSSAPPALPYALWLTFRYDSGAPAFTARIRREVGPSTSNVLYLLDNNIGLNAFYDRLKETLQRLGIDGGSHFPIIRLYSMDGEVGSGVKRDTQNTPAGRLDREAAETKLSSLTDQFLLEATLTRISIDTQDARDALRNAKHRYEEGSLCSGAFKYFEDNTNDFPELHQLVTKVKGGQELDDTEFGNFKAWTKTLLEKYLYFCILNLRGQLFWNPVGRMVQ